MIAIYILLGIIAVGVLLASESGQKLLFWITAVLIVVGLGYLSFWIIIFIVALFSDQSSRNSVLSVLGAIMITGYLGYEISQVYKKIKKGEITKKTIKKFFNDKWGKDRSGSLLFLIGFSLIALFIIIAILSE